MEHTPADIDAALRQQIPKAHGPLAEAIGFILANKDEVPVRSMRDLAKRAGVAPVTLVRLAQRLGFNGFDDFREVYVAALIGNRGRNLGQAAQLVSLGQREGDLGFAAKFAERELEVQRHAIADLKENDLSAAVQTLVRAARVYVIGRRPFFAAAYGFAYALRKAKPDTQLLDVGGGLALEFDSLTSKDVFVGFTAYPYSRITLGLGKTARSQGAAVIAITDSENAPLAQIAGHTFLTQIRSYAFPDSVAGAQLIGNILVGLTVSKLGPAALERVRRNETEIEASGEYVVKPPKRARRSPAATSSGPKSRR
ncbi:MAG: MurR/RpiR family transcriptional regulator [Alphaproteobacteria bacterium]|nr:MurR/RpiR family transcriptional regulator [Alphaproteobacteria bacterium]